MNVWRGKCHSCYKGPYSLVLYKNICYGNKNIVFSIFKTIVNFSKHCKTIKTNPRKFFKIVENLSNFIILLLVYITIYIYGY